MDSSGFVKSLSTDEILEIVRTESEDLNRERERVAPKLIFLNLVSNQITANMAEVYTEVSGQVEYMTVSTTLYCNSFPYRG